MTHVAFVLFRPSKVTAEYRVTDEILLLKHLYPVFETLTRNNKTR